MHLEAADQLVLFLEACKSFHMFLNLPEETMDILIITVVQTAAIIPLATPTINLLVKVNPRNSSRQCQCTMGDRQLLEATEVLDHSNHSRLATLFLKAMLDPRLNPCKASFPVSH
jgi:hypothetical protein